MRHKFVVVTKKILIFSDGFEWDAKDMLDTLGAIGEGGHVITDQTLGTWLLDNKVAESLGTRWISGATPGGQLR